MNPAKLVDENKWPALCWVAFDILIYSPEETQFITYNQVAITYVITAVGSNKVQEDWWGWYIPLIPCKYTVEKKKIYKVWQFNCSLM